MDTLAVDHVGAADVAAHPDRPAADPERRLRHVERADVADPLLHRRRQGARVLCHRPARRRVVQHHDALVRQAPRPRHQHRHCRRRRSPLARRASSKRPSAASAAPLPAEFPESLAASGSAELEAQGVLEGRGSRTGSRPRSRPPGDARTLVSSSSRPASPSSAAHGRRPASARRPGGAAPAPTSSSARRLVTGSGATRLTGPVSRSSWSAW